MSLTFRAQAFGPLAKVEWTIPPGVSVVVGPNRVGKSTLLALPEFVRLAIWDSLNEAVKRIFGGPAYLRNFDLPSTSPCGVGISVEKYAWDIDIKLTAGALALFCAERLRFGDELVLTRQFGAADGECEGRSIYLGTRSIPAVCHAHEKNSGGEPLLAMPETGPDDVDSKLLPYTVNALIAGVMLAAHATLSQSYRAYNYEIQHLTKFGSIQSDALGLDPSGANVFPLLRNWRDSSETEARFEFVLSTLREAFPHVAKIDFEQAGQTVTMAVRDHRWPNRKVPISRESTGLVTALLQLCAVASTEAGLVTIDELETSLHPHAIRVLIAAFRRWAKDHDLRIVLATQSETVLDQFHDDPGQIFVIEPNQPSSPRALTDMFDAEYLSQFSLGDLFSHLEFGSNREPASP